MNMFVIKFIGCLLLFIRCLFVVYCVAIDQELPTESSSDEEDEEESNDDTPTSTDSSSDEASDKPVQQKPTNTRTLPSPSSHSKHCKI